jgi:hypothetical protein
MKRIVRLTESDLTRIVRKTINENKRSFLLEAPVAKSVQLDCALNTIDSMKMTQEMITKYCVQAQNKGTTTLSQQYNMTKKDQIILTRAELDSIGASSADVVLASDGQVDGVVFRMKKELTNPSSMGGGVAAPFYSTAAGAGQGTGRVAGGVSQINPYVTAGVTTAEAVRKLGEKQAKASQSFK